MTFGGKNYLLIVFNKLFTLNCIQRDFNGLTIIRDKDKCEKR